MTKLPKNAILEIFEGVQEDEAKPKFSNAQTKTVATAHREGSPLQDIFVLSPHDKPREPVWKSFSTTTRERLQSTRLIQVESAARAGVLVTLFSTRISKFSQ